MKTLLKMLLTLIVALIFTSNLMATTIYVSSSATGSNNGTNWANAYTSISKAMNSAEMGDKIWVAAGNYYLQYEGKLRNSDTLFVKRGITLIGGLSGTEDNEFELKSRNWIVNKTKLNFQLKIIQDGSEPKQWYPTIIDGFFLSKTEDKTDNLIKERSIYLRNCRYESESEMRVNNAKTENRRYAKGRLLIKYKENSNGLKSANQQTMSINNPKLKSVDLIGKKHKIREFKRAYVELKNKEMQTKIGADRWHILQFPEESDLLKIAEEYRHDPNIECVTFDYAIDGQIVPTDPRYVNQWGHNNIGQLPSFNPTTSNHDGPPVGTVGFDAKLESAYNIIGGFGDNTIVVGIIDTGVDSDHPDLAPNIVAGWNFSSNNSNTDDFIGHGTVCAGIVAAKTNNGIGISGVAGNCKIMPLKVANDEGEMFFSAVQNALYYAADHGCDIVNISLGASNISSDPATDIALQYAYNAGVIILASSGNTGLSNVYYPASNQYVIAVGSASPCGNRKSSTSCDGETEWGSCYGVDVKDGAGSIDIIAPSIIPSSDIVGSSGYGTDDYVFANGTSVSTAFAAGVCALIKSAHPDWTPVQIRRQITISASDIVDSEATAGWDKYTGYGMVNAYNALTISAPADYPPVFTSTGPFSIRANLTEGGIVGDINSNNGDGGGSDGGITYSITTNCNTDADTNNAFIINSTNGIITVNDAGDLNYSAIPINITIRANDGFATTDINVSVSLIAVTSNIIYVNANATGSQNGTSWANAFRSLHSALNASANGSQIWVAKGVYYATDVFSLKEGVDIYGGFVGTETMLSQRNWETNKTILSGDIEHNDVNTDGNFVAETWADIVGDNPNIVEAMELDSARLDGFILTAGGMSTGCWNGGAAIAIGFASPTFKNLIICGNQSPGLGGAVYIFSQLPDKSYPSFENVTISGNRVTDEYGSGGGMFSQYSGCYVNMKNVIFDNNFAAFGGGGFASDAGNHSIENVTFNNNSTNNYGGGVHFSDNVNATFKNVLFTKNRSYMGGGMYAFRNGNLTMNDVSFIENTVIDRAEDNCGGGLAIAYVTVNATNLIFKGNIAADGGGGLSVDAAILNLKNAVFSGNHAISWIGGGLYVSGGGNATIANVTFNGNRSCYYNSNPMGGALGNRTSSNITVSNSILWGNYPNEVFDLQSPITIKNSNVYQASGVYSGIGNINKDPMFNLPVNPLNAPSINGDLRVIGLSPCINMGSNSLNTEIKDIRGELRIQDATIDMGAYEWTKDIDPERHIHYVDKNATGNNNGTTWENAFPSLQTALDNASEGDQIWVAKGTYKPTSAYSLTNSPRYYHFELKNDVGIYGGFAGTETSISQRTDFGYGGSNETILSGDIGTVGDYSDNCYHVILNVTTVLSSSSELNGVTIIGGNANGTNPHNRGGGINLTSSSPTISQVTFSGNRGNYGGGAFNQNASPNYVNCLFLQNQGGTSGGGMRNNSATPTVTNCTFANNTAGSIGGGVDNTSSSAIYNNCILWGNTATTGKQIYGTGAGTSVLNYSCYADETNDVVTLDVAVLNVSNNNTTSNPQFINSSNGDYRLYGNSPCANTGNNSYNSYNEDIRGQKRIQNSTIEMGAYEWTPSIDPAVIIYVKSDAVGNNNGTSWANAFTSLQSALDLVTGYEKIYIAKGTYKPSSAYSLTNSPRYFHFELKENVEIYGGFAGTETSIDQRTDYGFGGSNETILSGDIGVIGDYSDNCYHVIFNVGTGLTSNSILNGLRITNGNANGTNPHNRGGGINLTSSSPTISQVTFSDNRGNYGGGAFNQNATPNYVNCLFSQNQGNTSGGGMMNNSATPIVTNCTFVKNTAGSIGGGVNNTSSSAIYNNCILWGNTATTGKQIYGTGAGTSTLNYSCYANEPNDVVTLDVAVFNVSNNNITSNPQFINFSNGNYRLLGISPCVNTGNNTYNALSTDLRGQNRVQNTTIDMGAYEWTESVDYESKIYYVNDNAVGNNSGVSWINAFISLQSALEVAIKGDQIWVAAGIYKPSKEDDGTIDEPRKFSFQMKDGVEIYGGFTGTETLLIERDFITNETVLSGDLLSNDVVSGEGTTLSFSGNEENCYHIFFNFNPITSSAILDGFTISGGNAEGDFPGGVGAGMFNIECNPTIRNTTFKNNRAANCGGLYLFGSNNSELTNLVFKNNDGGDWSGAICFYESSATLTNALFEGNYGRNGALSNVNSTSTITNATFSGNYAWDRGGAISNEDNGTLVLNNCIIWGNKANGDANEDGIVDGNEIYHSGNITTLNNCCYKNEIGDVFGTLNLGLGNITSNPLFVNATNNDFRLFGNSPCVNNGNNTYNTLSTDIRGKARIQNTTIDMGAYEWTSGTDPANNLTTGIENNSIHSDMQVYPNPSNGLVNFRFTSENGDKTMIDILTLTGQLVYRVFEGSVEQGMEQIVQFTKPLNEGLYIYKLTNGSLIKTGRLIRIRGNN